MSEHKGHKGQPFYFDNIVFDSEGGDGYSLKKDTPKPEFTAQELEEQKKIAYEEGRKAGFEESQAGITKQIAGLMQNIRQNTGVLFAAEDKRKDIYEAESLRLVQTI